MTIHALFNRRRFMQTGVLATTALSSGGFSRLGLLEANTRAKDPFRGLKIGVASYSLRKFSLHEAIAMTKKLGVKYITLKDFHLPLKSTKAEREAARRKIEDAGLVLMGGGVIYMKNDEREIRSAFDYAKESGMPAIVASPDAAALDFLDKMVNEYQIRIAIHNHGPGDDKYPSPHDVYKAVKNHDVRIGLCIDIGHTFRFGVDPIECIQKYSSRLYDLHFKDVTGATTSGENIEVGRGIINIVGLLKALLDIKYAHHVALEYEINETNPLMGMNESFAFSRGVLAALA